VGHSVFLNVRTKTIATRTVILDVGEPETGACQERRKFGTRSASPKSRFFTVCQLTVGRSIRPGTGAREVRPLRRTALVLRIRAERLPHSDKGAPRRWLRRARNRSRCFVIVSTALVLNRSSHKIRVASNSMWFESAGDDVREFAVAEKY